MLADGGVIRQVIGWPLLPLLHAVSRRALFVSHDASFRRFQPGETTPNPASGVDPVFGRAV